jgi:catechol 2,3-dioxygenase-like lactoylglutathione lyase family enzyme
MSTQTIHDDATQARTAAVDVKLEVVVIPVEDVDRAKRFYQGLGWRPDTDFSHGDDWRLVQAAAGESLKMPFKVCDSGHALTQRWYTLRDASFMEFNHS